MPMREAVSVFVCVLGGVYSEEFEVKVGVQQCSVLSPLLFFIVLEALSREFRSGSPERTSMLMTLLSSLNRWGMWQEALDLERSNGGERAESIQLTLDISTSLISNNRLSRSENLVPAYT